MGNPDSKQMNALAARSNLLLGGRNEHIKFRNSPPHVLRSRLSLRVRECPVYVACLKSIKPVFEVRAPAFQLFKIIGDRPSHVAYGSVLTLRHRSKNRTGARRERDDMRR
jgi:hypothetical protein